MAIEQARYTVLGKGKDFELRHYEPYIVAETLVEGDFSEVGNEGFRRLFAYISGNNRSRQSISMTTPVSQVADSEKITTTAPVNQQERKRQVADHLYDALGIYAGNATGTSGPAGGSTASSRKAHGCAQVFGHLEPFAI